MDYQNIVVTSTLNIRDALQILDSTGKKVLFVTENKKLIGSVSDGDVRRWILKNGSLENSISALMNRDPVYIKERNKKKAIQIMNYHSIPAIPVLNKRQEIETILFWGEELERQTGELNVKVVIMAGGKGERLLPYTSIVPKPLIPVGDKPIVELIIDNFAKYGCKDFTLTINYKKNMIRAYFDDLEKGYHISYVEEQNPLGTGGSLSLLKNELTEAFFVSNCDILLQVDYQDVYEKHKRDKNIITIITSLKRYKMPYGIISTGNEGNVISMIEKPSMDYLINTGVYVIDPIALETVSTAKFMNITEMIEDCIDKGMKVGIYPISEDAWMDMGQFENLEEMRKKLRR